MNTNICALGLIPHRTLNESAVPHCAAWYPTDGLGPVCPSVQQYSRRQFYAQHPDRHLDTADDFGLTLVGLMREVNALTRCAEVLRVSWTPKGRQRALPCPASSRRCLAA